MIKVQADIISANGYCKCEAVPPIAYAGADQTVLLPNNTSSLIGSAIDANGIVTNYKWTKISGPKGTIVSPDSRVTSIKGLMEGTYIFQLMITNNNGITATDIVQIDVITTAASSNLISAYVFNGEAKNNRNFVYQNFPNPVINSTTIKYEISEKAPVKIIVFNAAGIRVGVLTDEIKQPGSYQVQWNASNLPAGNYIYTIFIGNQETTKKMVKVNLIKYLLWWGCQLRLPHHNFIFYKRSFISLLSALLIIRDSNWLGKNQASIIFHSYNV